MTHSLKPYSIESKGDIRLYLNEFRFPHHENVVNAVKNVVNNNESVLLSQYPPGASADLKQRIVDYITNIDVQNVTVSAGSDEVLRAAIDICHLRGIKTVIVGTPTYTHFTHYAKLHDMEIIEYPLDLKVRWKMSESITMSDELNETLHNCMTQDPVMSHLEIPIDSSDPVGYKQLMLYKEFLDEGALVYIGNPNNPLGNIMSVDQIEKLITSFPRSIFLLDEAYAEYTETLLETSEKYAERANNHKSTDLVKNNSNLIVARTFSKAFGLAALRVGYAIAHKSMIENLNSAINPKALSLFGIEASAAVLKEKEYYKKTTKQTIINLYETVTILRELGWYVIPTAANFFLLYAHDSAELVEYMAEHGVAIRDRGMLPSLTDFVRITVGTKHECELLIKILSALNPPIIPSIRQFYTPKETIVELRNLLQQLIIFSDINESFPKLWAHGGTLLGVVRHKGIIPWDDDIDMAYVGSIADLEPFVEKLAELGYTLQLNRTKSYWQLGTNKPGEVISEIHIDIFPFIYDSDEKKYVNSDVRFRNENPDCIDAHCNISYTKEELFPLKFAQFYETKILIPFESEKVLSRALGENYMTTAKIRTKNEGKGTVTYDITDFTAA